MAKSMFLFISSLSRVFVANFHEFETKIEIWKHKMAKHSILNATEML